VNLDTGHGAFERMGFGSLCEKDGEAIVDSQKSDLSEPEGAPEDTAWDNYY